MEYQGRSPLKDVARSVVMGAAMIPASVLASCTRHAETPPTEPNGNGNPPTMTAGDAGLANNVIIAPPPTIVRPRVDPTIPIGASGHTTGMPTRGFSGGSRPR